jgi:uncharacterized protein
MDTGTVDNRQPTAPPDWRSTIRAAAHRAACADSQLHWGDNDISFNYRWEHVEATVRLAIRLAELTGADSEVVEAAAWLHDIAKPDSWEHGRDGARIAQQILGATDFAQAKVEAVAEAIEKHVGLFTDERVEPLEAAVVWDADKLAKLGATAVLHFVGYKIMTGRPTTVAWLEELPDLLWMHRTVQSFQTAPAQEIGRQRLETYRAFWATALQEFDGDDLLDVPGETKRAGH